MPTLPIATFSPKSRAKLLAFLEDCRDRSLYRINIFVTLDYPQAVLERAPLTPEAVKDHLHALRQRFLRAWPHGYLVWRLEPTAEGRPHLHAVGHPGLPEVTDFFHAWLRRAWEGILGLESGLCPFTCDVQRPLDAEAVCIYIAKPEPPILGPWRPFWFNAGRRWGVMGSPVIIRPVTTECEVA